MPMNTTIDWMAAAAWVQAVGSIAAIGVAIWIGYQSDKRARTLVADERKRQATVAASIVANTIRRVALDLRLKRKELDSDMSLVTSKRAHGPVHWLLKSERFLTEIPEGTTRLCDFILTFDVNVGLQAIGAIVALGNFNDSLRRIDERGSSEAAVMDALAILRENMYRVESALTTAARAIETAHGLTRVLHDDSHPTATPLEGDATDQG